MAVSMIFFSIIRFRRIVGFLKERSKVLFLLNFGQSYRLSSGLFWLLRGQISEALTN